MSPKAASVPSTTHIAVTMHAITTEFVSALRERVVEHLLNHRVEPFDREREHGRVVEREQDQDHDRAEEHEEHEREEDRHDHVVSARRDVRPRVRERRGGRSDRVGH